MGYSAILIRGRLSPLRLRSQTIPITLLKNSLFFSSESKLISPKLFALQTNTSANQDGCAERHRPHYLIMRAAQHRAKFDENMM